MSRRIIPAAVTFTNKIQSNPGYVAKPAKLANESGLLGVPPQRPLCQQTNNSYPLSHLGYAHSHRVDLGMLGPRTQLSHSVYHWSTNTQDTWAHMCTISKIATTFSISHHVSEGRSTRPKQGKKISLTTLLRLLIYLTCVIISAA